MYEAGSREEASIIARQLKRIDIGDNPQLLQIVREVQAGNEPLVLRQESEDVAILRPVKRARKARMPRGKPLTHDDPLWKLVGSATSAAPTDATKKHGYLAEALVPRQP